MQVLVVSISPQTRASFAAKYQLSPLEVAKKLTTLFKTVASPSVVHVFDTSFARDLSLMATLQDLQRRLSLDKILERRNVQQQQQQQQQEQSERSPMLLPMLASACPGWICYAEKTQGDVVLPYISATRSPQQMMGWLVKEYFASALPFHGTTATMRQTIYHCSIMPCFDKKLEASRSDFTIDNVRDVDCVLSSGELEVMLQEYGQPLADIPPSSLDRPFWNVVVDPATQQETLVGTAGTGSGGYVDYLIQSVARQLREEASLQVDIVKQTGRNSDVTEYAITLDGRVLVRMATAYGFRNIQNVVRRLKQKPSAMRRKVSSDKASWEMYDFVEVMACPSGCINGGGQLKPNETQIEGIVAVKEFVAAMDREYQAIPSREPTENTAVLEIVEYVVGSLRVTLHFVGNGSAGGPVTRP